MLRPMPYNKKANFLIKIGKNTIINEIITLCIFQVKYFFEVIACEKEPVPL